MEERSPARNVPRSGLLTMPLGGADCFKFVLSWGRMSFYGNLPLSRVGKSVSCVSLRV